jgi:8-oxo-dGTP diphosphatase
VSDPATRFATPRIAAGALFVNGDRVLLVHKTYANGWDIPGGYVDQGESPAAACERELREELGIQRKPRQLLVMDWAPHPEEGDKILYIFDCGELGDDEGRIHLGAAELDRWAWIPIAQLGDYVVPRLQRRLTGAHRAYSTGRPAYLENGQQALAPYPNVPADRPAEA